MFVERRIHADQQPATSNLVSLPYQPLDQLRYSLSAADLHIISLGDNMSGIVHPCKIYGALSIGRPVLALGPPESYLNDIVATTSFGGSIEHGVGLSDGTPFDGPQHLRLNFGCPRARLRQGLEMMAEAARAR